MNDYLPRPNRQPRSAARREQTAARGDLDAREGAWNAGTSDRGEALANGAERERSTGRLPARGDDWDAWDSARPVARGAAENARYDAPGANGAERERSTGRLPARGDDWDAWDSARPVARGAVEGASARRGAVENIGYETPGANGADGWSSPGRVYGGRDDMRTVPRGIAEDAVSRRDPSTPIGAELPGTADADKQPPADPPPRRKPGTDASRQGAPATAKREAPDADERPDAWRDARAVLRTSPRRDAYPRGEARNIPGLESTLQEDRRGLWNAIRGAVRSGVTPHGDPRNDPDAHTIQGVRHGPWASLRGDSVKDTDAQDDGDDTNAETARDKLARLWSSVRGAARDVLSPGGDAGSDAHTPRETRAALWKTLRGAARDVINPQDDNIPGADAPETKGSRDQRVAVWKPLRGETWTADDPQDDSGGSDGFGIIGIDAPDEDAQAARTAPWKPLRGGGRNVIYPQDDGIVGTDGPDEDTQRAARLAAWKPLRGGVLSRTKPPDDEESDDFGVKGKGSPRNPVDGVDARIPAASDFPNQRRRPGMDTPDEDAQAARTAPWKPLRGGVRPRVSSEEADAPTDAVAGDARREKRRGPFAALRSAARLGGSPEDVAARKALHYDDDEPDAPDAVPLLDDAPTPWGKTRAAAQRGTPTGTLPYRRPAREDASDADAVFRRPAPVREDAPKEAQADPWEADTRPRAPVRRPSPDPEVAPFVRRRPGTPAPPAREMRGAVSPMREPRPALPPDAWEDTSTHLPEPEQTTFFKRQPPWFWAICAVLMVALFTVMLLIGARAWQEGAALREAERIARLLEAEKAQYKFPDAYRAAIEGYAQEQGVDPALVGAVIYQESRFKPDAVSGLGARGLMQIMVDTGDWIAGKLGEKDGYTFDRMFDPEANLRYGIWYLGFLNRTFDGDPVKMLAGYHAGQNQVAKWLSDPAVSPDGVTLTAIPFTDTDQYVKKVMSAYAIYTRLYYTPEETEPPVQG